MTTRDPDMALQFKKIKKRKYTTAGLHLHEVLECGRNFHLLYGALFSSDMIYNEPTLSHSAPNISVFHNFFSPTFPPLSLYLGAFFFNFTRTRLIDDRTGSVLRRPHITQHRQLNENEKQTSLTQNIMFDKPLSLGS